MTTTTAIIIMDDEFIIFCDKDETTNIDNDCVNERNTIVVA